MTAGRKARRAAGNAGSSRALIMAARVGFAASGLIHLLMGYIAVRVALHHGGESDQSGAFAQLIKRPGGDVALWITVIGFAALALWLLLQAALGIGSPSKKRWARSLVSLGKAAAYLALAWTALAFALKRPKSATSSARQASGTILSLPGGQVLPVIVGLATAGVGRAPGWRNSDAVVPHPARGARPPGSDGDGSAAPRRSLPACPTGCGLPAIVGFAHGL